MLQEKIQKTPPPSSGRFPSPSSLGEDWRRYVVPQCWGAFTEDDHAVWDLLFARQVELLGDRVISPFFDGIDLLKLSHPGIPDVEGLNAILTPRTGWTTVAVPGLVPDDIFFAMLTERVFPVGNFIRTREQLDYLEAPDCFHDMFGHIPMLAHHDYADMTRHIGELGTAAIEAGLASSFGESHYSLESDTVERLPFSVERAINTPYKHDAFQPRYLVSESLEQTISEVLALTPQRLLSL